MGRAMSISRRNFLRGSTACAAVAAMPLPAALVPLPIFEVSIGIYQGVVVREVMSLDRAAMRDGLKTWWLARHPEADDGG